MLLKKMNACWLKKLRILQMQELQDLLEVLTDTELIEEAGLPTFPDPLSRVTSHLLSGQEGCRSVVSKDKKKSSCSDIHLTTGFPLLFDGTDNPKAQVRRGLYHIILAELYSTAGFIEILQDLLMIFTPQTHTTCQRIAHPDAKFRTMPLLWQERRAACHSLSRAPSRNIV